MVNYPNKKANFVREKQSTSNRGMVFEAMINEANDYYRVNNIAIIHKKPIPVQIVNVDYPNRSSAVIKEAYYKVPSTTDYNGIYKGYYIDFEAKEPLEDKVGYLNCWIDYLVIRYKKEKIIREISDKAEFHVVNAMSRESHPCEILSDLMTLNEMKGRLKNQKIVFVGEGANISNTWFEAAAKLDLNLTQICPTGYEISNELFKYARDNSKGEIVVTNDFEKGIRNADIILTDGWPPSENGKSIPEIFLPYQLTVDKLKSCNTGYIVNPCPPFTRGKEVSEEIINSDRFIGYKGKENLLHMQKAILGILN